MSFGIRHIVVDDAVRSRKRFVILLRLECLEDIVALFLPVERSIRATNHGSKAKRLPVHAQIAGEHPHLVGVVLRLRNGRAVQLRMQRRDTNENEHTEGSNCFQLTQVHRDAPF